MIHFNGPDIRSARIFFGRWNRIVFHSGMVVWVRV